MESKNIKTNSKIEVSKEKTRASYKTLSLSLAKYEKLEKEIENIKAKMKKMISKKEQILNSTKSKINELSKELNIVKGW